MRYYIIVGESSGDLYGGLLMQQLIKKDSDAQFLFWGGPEMKKHASAQVKSLEETAFMGFWEVAKNAFKIRELFRYAKSSVLKFQPHIIIFIDYPGFNLRMMKWAKAQNFRTCFYISPQLWAWKRKRHLLLKEYADLFFVILPFEKNFYKNLDTPCIYHGHPILELIKMEGSFQRKNKTVGLFPGSRTQEIEKHFGLLKQFAQQNPSLKFLVAGVKHVNENIYRNDIKNIEILYDSKEKIMKEAELAIASSGTATLELALYGVPQIVIYKTSALSYAIGKRLVKTRFISLVNIIAEHKIVDELLQENFNLEELKNSFDKLNDPNARTKILNAYSNLRKKLGDGHTSEKVAQDIINYLKKPKD